MTPSEKNTHKKIRISIIDVLIVLAVAACIGGTFVHYKIYEKNNAVVTDDRASVSILISSVSEDAEDRLSAGEELFYGDKQLLGIINEVSAEDAVVCFTDEDGRIAETTDPSLKDIRITVTVNGEFTEDGFLANGTEYTAAGMEIGIFTPDFSGKGLIFDVKKQSE